MPIYYYAIIVKIRFHDAITPFFHFLLRFFFDEPPLLPLLIIAAFA